MAVKIVANVNWGTTDGDDWQEFEPDGILSVYNTRAHQVAKLTIQNEAEAISLLREVRIHKKMSLWVPDTNAHVIHEFVGAMQRKEAISVLIEVFRVSAGGSADGVKVFDEEFEAKVVNVLAAWNEKFVVNFRLVGGVAEEYFDDE